MHPREARCVALHRGNGGVGNASYLWLPMRRHDDPARPWTISYEEGWMPAQMAQGTDLTTWAY